MVMKIHFRKVLKLGKRKKEFPLCYNTQMYDFPTTTDKGKVTCNRCKLRLEKKLEKKEKK